MDDASSCTSLVPSSTYAPFSPQQEACTMYGNIYRPKGHKQSEGARSAPISIHEMTFCNIVLYDRCLFSFLSSTNLWNGRGPLRSIRNKFIFHNNRRIPAGCDEKRGAHYGTAKRLEDLRAPPCPNDANVRTVAKQSTDMLGAGCWYR